MALTRENKKRIAIYSVKTASAILRTGITAANYITRFGLKAGEMMATLVVGSAMSMADEICGVHSRTNIGDGMMHGLSSLLAKGADFTANTANKSISYIEKYAEEKIKHMR